MSEHSVEEWNLEFIYYKVRFLNYLNEICGGWLVVVLVAKLAHGVSSVLTRCTEG